jgi:hypothetical protein
MSKSRSLPPRGVRRANTRKLAKELGLDFHTAWAGFQAKRGVYIRHPAASPAPRVAATKASDVAINAGGYLAFRSLHPTKGWRDTDGRPRGEHNRRSWL